MILNFFFLAAIIETAAKLLDDLDKSFRAIAEMELDIKDKGNKISFFFILFISAQYLIFF